MIAAGALLALAVALVLLVSVAMGKVPPAPAVPLGVAALILGVALFPWRELRRGG